MPTTATMDETVNWRFGTASDPAAATPPAVRSPRRRAAGPHRRPGRRHTVEARQPSSGPCTRPNSTRIRPSANVIWPQRSGRRPGPLRPPARAARQQAMAARPVTRRRRRMLPATSRPGEHSAAAGATGQNRRTGSLPRSRCRARAPASYAPPTRRAPATREDGARAETVDRRADPHRLNGRREARRQRADHHQYGTADDQLAVAELVAQHAEGQFEDDHRDHEGRGDPGQLRADRVEGLLEVRR